MQQQLRITAIIPTYNRATQVGNAIRSAIEQSPSPFEVIVADDGSTDATLSAVRQFGSSVKLITGPNRGKAATLNNAIRQAAGDWIAVLDDDDTWAADKLRWQAQALAEHPECGVCFSNSAYVNNPTSAPDSFAKVLYKHKESIGILDNSTQYVLHPPHGIFIQSCLIAKHLLFKAGGFDERLRVADDTDMILRLSLLTRFCYVNRPLTLIDRTPRRSSGLTDARRDRPEVFLADQEIMYRSWLTLLKDGDPSAKSLVQRRCAEVQNAWGNLHIVRTEYPEARERFNKAYSIEPRQIYRIKSFLTKYCPALLKRRASK